MRNLQVGSKEDRGVANASTLAAWIATRLLIRLGPAGDGWAKPPIGPTVQSQDPNPYMRSESASFTP
jgi:hypothetical protein